MCELTSLTKHKLREGTAWLPYTPISSPRAETSIQCPSKNSSELNYTDAPTPKIKGKKKKKKQAHSRLKNFEHWEELSNNPGIYMA